VWKATLLSGAFLGTELRDRAVYVRLPAGEYTGKVLLLLKFVYGLKTSGREFVQQFSEQILNFTTKVKCPKTGEETEAKFTRLAVGKIRSKNIPVLDCMLSINARGLDCVLSLFVRTQQVARSRGQQCGDIELAGYLANVAGAVPLVLDLRIAHDRFGSSSDPTLHGHLHYPNDIDRPLNEATADKIRKYCADYNYNPPNSISFMPAIATTSGRLHSEFVCLLFLQAHRESDRFFAVSGVQLAQCTSGLFHFRRAAFSSQLKSKVGSTLAKTAALRINLNLDGAPITSKSHTHPSHSQTSRLLTSSLSLGVPVPRSTQCLRGV
jgi:hypothetical protein